MALRFSPIQIEDGYLEVQILVRLMEFFSICNSFYINRLQILFARKNAV